MLRGTHVLFGGSPSDNETWEYDGGTWSLKSSWGPPTVSELGMAFHLGSGVTVLFGGRLENDVLDQTWEWDGSSWTRRWVSGPSERHGHAMVYDATHDVIVLFGGQTDIGATYSNETWLWDGAAWTLAANAGPSPRFLHAMAFDSLREVTVLFGGNFVTNLGDTWEWDGSTWIQREVTGPAPRYGHTMAYDSARNVSVLFGGDVGGGETWEWNGTGWVLRAVPGPSSRVLHSMSFDSNRNVPVLFGGFGWSGVQGDTWELCSTPVLSVPPLSKVACAASQATFVVGAVGSGPLTYQWQRGNPLVDIPGATGAVLSFASVTALDVGPYACVVTNPCGAVTSNIVTLSVCFADFNCDGSTDFFDYLDFVSGFSMGDPRADFNGDSTLDFFDYLDFVDAFGSTC